MDDERAIQRSLTTYSQTASIGDWDGAVGTYLVDATWSIPHLDFSFTGHDAIRGALVAFFEHMDYVIQMNAPALVTVSASTAPARSFSREQDNPVRIGALHVIADAPTVRRLGKLLLVDHDADPVEWQAFRGLPDRTLQKHLAISYFADLEREVPSPAENPRLLFEHGPNH